MRIAFILKDILAITLVDVVNFFTLYLAVYFLAMAKLAEQKYGPLLGILQRIQLPQPQSTYIGLGILAIYLIIFLKRNLKVSKTSFPRSVASIFLTTGIIFFLQNYLLNRNILQKIFLNDLGVIFLIIATIRAVFYLISVVITPLSTIKAIKPVSSSDPANLPPLLTGTDPSPQIPLSERFKKILPIIKSWLGYFLKILILVHFLNYVLAIKIPIIEVDNLALVAILLGIFSVSIFRLLVSKNLSFMAKLDIILTVNLPLLIVFITNLDKLQKILP